MEDELDPPVELIWKKRPDGSTAWYMPGQLKAEDLEVMLLESRHETKKTAMVYVGLYNWLEEKKKTSDTIPI